MRARFLALALAALVAVPAAASAQEPAKETPERKVEKLHDPGVRSYWAFVVRSTPVRRNPSMRSSRIGKLGTVTEDGTDELVALLERTVDSKGHRWVRVRTPWRRVNRTGWVPQRVLGIFYPVDTWLRISRNRFTATLVKKGKVVFRARIGIGKRQWPTPRGEFYVRNRLHGFNNPVYGPLAFGTSAKSKTLTDWPGGGVIGIHGTNQPGILPGRVSHGCIRLRNKDILRLDKLMPVGTPISIR